MRVLLAYRGPVLAAEGVAVSGLTAADAVAADVVRAGGEDEAYCSTVTFVALRGEYALANHG